MRTRRELLTRAAAREQQDIDGQRARVEALEQRHDGSRRAGRSAVQLGHRAGAGRGGAAGRPGHAQRRAGSGRAPRPRRRRPGPTRPRRPGTAPRHGPKRSSVPSPTSRVRAVASSCARSTASWARWSTWSRSTRDGTPPSRRPPVPAWPRWWSTGAARPRPPWPRCASAASPVRCWRPATRTARRPPASGTCPPAAAPSRSGPTCAPAGAATWPSRCSTALVGRAVRVDGWEEAIDLSLARDDLIVVTPDGDRFAATGWRVRSGSGVVTAAAVEEAQPAGRGSGGEGRAGPGRPVRCPHCAGPLPRRAGRGRAGLGPPRVGARSGARPTAPGRPRSRGG